MAFPQRKVYKVTFVVQGDTLGDDINLTKENLREGLLNLLDADHARSYFGNRSINTLISKVAIQDIKG